MTIVTGERSRVFRRRPANVRVVIEIVSSLRCLPSGGALVVEGGGAGAPLLLLHGVGGAAWSWRPQRAAFAASRRVFTWEARGHGAARRVSDAGLADYYTDAREALAAVVAEQGEAPIIVAHSMGGLLALALACDRASDVRGLFLIDPVYATGERDAYGHFPPALGAVVRWLCTPLLRSFERDGKISRALSRWAFAGSFEDRARMEVAWRDQRTQIPVEYPRMLRESFGRPAGFELRPFASEVTQPVFLLEGARKNCGARFPHLVEGLRGRLGSRFYADRIAGGHYLQLDRPDETNERLARFLASSELAVSLT